MPTTEEFLRAILPSSGLYCLVLIKGEQVRQNFFQTIPQICQAISKSLTSDWEVYHGCAAYVDTRRLGENDGSTPYLSEVPRRTKESVRTCRSLWLDIDDKDVTDPIETLHSFVTACSLPSPLVVLSGHGIHAYWPLRKELDRSSWERWAAALRSACEAQGLKADPARTCDIASILRPPGTWNRKGDPVEVLCGPITGPYDMEEFNGLLTYGSSLNISSRVNDVSNFFEGYQLIDIEYGINSGRYCRLPFRRIRNSLFLFKIDLADCSVDSSQCRIGKKHHREQTGAPINIFEEFANA